MQPVTLHETEYRFFCSIILFSDLENTEITSAWKLVFLAETQIDSKKQ